MWLNGNGFWAGLGRRFCRCGRSRSPIWFNWYGFVGHNPIGSGCLLSLVCLAYMRDLSQRLPVMNSLGRFNNEIELIFQQLLHAAQCRLGPRSRGDGYVALSLRG